MIVTDAQVRKFMEEMSKHGQIGRASMMAGMDRKTGRKYLSSGILPRRMGRRMGDVVAMQNGGPK